MTQLSDTEIVITSSWREAFSLKEMQALFSLDIAERIIGVTPNSHSREGHYRHREVLEFIKRKGFQGRRWVALEDDPEHFPESAHVLLIDTDVGFGQQAADRLIAHVTGR